MQSLYPRFACICLALICLFLTSQSVVGQSTVFSDNFNTDNNTSWTTSGQIGTSSWNVIRPGADWGARRNTSPMQLELTNDASGSSNLTGWVLVYTTTTSFGSPYSPVLANGSAVSWTFNMRQIRPDPAGFDSGNYGVAFILAGQSGTGNSTGSGYAVVLGQSGSTDPVRLVRFTGGFNANSDLTNMIVSSTAGLTDFGDEYLSIRVTYNPCDNNTWELFVRNDGTTAFVDPQTGTLTSQGTISDATYTGLTLDRMAAYWNGSTAANQTSFFDNVSVVVNEPALTPGTIAAICEDSTTAFLPYSNLLGGANQYTIDYSPGAESVGFVDVVNAALPSSPITLTVPGGAAPGTYTGTLTVRNSTSLCVSDQYPISITIMECAMAPSMDWVLLENGEAHGSCSSTTDCENNIICYALRYIPNTTGQLSSYTTGFFVNCTDGSNPIFSNSSCVMTDNSNTLDACAAFDLVLFNASANSGGSGSVAVTQNVPIFLHQVCFTVPDDGTLTIMEDDITDLTTSIDPSSGPPVTEFPAYNDYVIDPDVECAILPLTWLDFTAEAAEDRVSLLTWHTTDEVNTARFIIERKTEATAAFEQIGTLKANLRSGVQSYTFTDEKASTGRNYYRIRQVDQDGKYAYSPIRQVTFSQKGLQLVARPNPVSDILLIEIYDASADGKMSLVSATGQNVWSGTTSAGTSKTELSVSQVAPGTYTLILTDGRDIRMEKIAIVH